MVGTNEKTYRTIGEVAESLDLPPHVLRFWETRFKELDPVKRAGGRRYYRPRDVELVKALRQLLYGQGYTIKGVQRILKEQGARAVIENALANRLGTEAGELEGFDEPQESMAAAEVPQLDLFAPGPAQLPPPIARPYEDASKLGDEDVRRLRLALADLAESRRLLQLSKD